MQSSPSAIVISSECNVKKECITPICYTPERLIRSQEYRILIPSPRCFTFSQARFTAENENREWKSRRCRKQLSRLIDSKQIGTQSKVFLSTISILPFSFDPKSEEGNAASLEPASSKATSWNSSATAAPDLIKFRGLPMRGIELLDVSDLLRFLRPRDRG